ncbi:MAG: FAD-binding oxidoreductase [Firmicutes bacterium HGW-Firmicutes-7]|nr:MAG: FAD-binding oxidoreductase [Firmicutes bacterium HGW-Firmicutes-7]
MKENTKAFIDKIRKDLPAVEILDREEECLIYAHGCYPVEYKWILQGKYKYLPSAILVPSCTEELSNIMKLANEYKVGIIPFGGGSGIVGGTIAENEEVMIDMKKFQEFSVNPINCTATGGAGVTGADFENMLNERGFTCGHYPQSFQSAVIGGMVATRAIGTFSTKYGKMDDMINSLEVVLPTGEIVSTHKAPKRSTGPELNELFLGSEGVYGIVTKAEIYIYPIAEKRFFEAYTFAKTENGLEAIRSFIQKSIKPAVIRLYDEVEASHKIHTYGFEKGFALLIVGYEGLKEMVDLEQKIVHDTCIAYSGIYKGEKAGKEWFESRFSTKKMLDFDRLKGGTADAIEVAAPWDCIVKVWSEMRKALAPLCVDVDCHFSHVYHTGSSVYVIFHAKTYGTDFDGEGRYKECLKVAIETSLKYGGNVSHHHGSGKAKAPYLHLEHGDAGYGVMKKIKEALDPAGILNKGVLGL